MTWFIVISVALGIIGYVANHADKIAQWARTFSHEMEYRAFKARLAQQKEDGLRRMFEAEQQDLKRQAAEELLAESSPDPTVAHAA
jgi:antirestriction protein ArdC